MNPFSRYHEAIHFLDGLLNLPSTRNYMQDPSNPAFYLDRMRAFLDALGHPEQGIKCIHITGTAGKGTVTNLLHDVIRLSGKRVGSFTSPSVVTSIESIRVDDQYIDPLEFADIVEELKPTIDEMTVQGNYGTPSSFEILLAIAFIYFKRQQCEWMVLEVGAGGRYDATNVIPNPIVTAITNIDYDHTRLLGKTLPEIAYAKAGIIKPGSIFFTTEHRPELLQLFEQVCKEEGASFFSVAHTPSSHETNQALVAAIMKYLGFRHEYLERALAQGSPLPGRFERMQSSPTIILDGAHNRSKIATTVTNLKQHTYHRLILIVGISQEKDLAEILSQIIPLADCVFFTRFQIPHRTCAHPQDLQKIAQPYFKMGATNHLILDPHRALEQALKAADVDDLILVTGSFFLVSELRTHWISEEQVLTQRKHIHV